MQIHFRLHTIDVRNMHALSCFLIKIPQQAIWAFTYCTCVGSLNKHNYYAILILTGVAMYVEVHIIKNVTAYILKKVLLWIGYLGGINLNAPTAA